MRRRPCSAKGYEMTSKDQRNADAGGLIGSELKGVNDELETGPSLRPLLLLRKEKPGKCSIKC